MGIVSILIVGAIFVALLVFVPFVRGFISMILRLVIFVAALFIALAGAAMLMNNETIFQRPGFNARATRFLTVNYAATSEKGLGDAPCIADKHAIEFKREPAPAKPVNKKEVAAQAGAAAPSATPTPSPEQLEQENVYDELVTRNYICGEGEAIPRDKLFEMARDTVNELRGWKTVHTDERIGLIDAIYTTRVFGFEDAVKIVVTPRADIELCSQSKVGEPDSTSALRFLHGDFGANIGHIKEFYDNFQPKADHYCKALEEKQKAKAPAR